MNVRDYLIQLGYEEADATTFASDPKMSKAFEAAARQYEEGQSAKSAAEQALNQVNQQKTELDKWWKETAQPAILSADTGTASARADAARYKAYIKSLKDQQYPVPDEWLKDDVQMTTPPVTNPAPTNNFDPKEFAYAQADAMTMLHDLDVEYQELYGARMPNAHGLLQEAKASNRSLRDLVSSKFNFEGKRQERNEAKIQERINAAVRDREAALEAKYAERSNPMLAPAVTSRAAAVVESMGDSKDSWKTKQGRTEAKKDRLLQFRNIAAKTA